MPSVASYPVGHPAPIDGVDEERKGSVDVKTSWALPESSRMELGGS